MLTFRITIRFFYPCRPIAAGPGMHLFSNQRLKNGWGLQGGGGVEG